MNGANLRLTRPLLFSLTIASLLLNFQIQESLAPRKADRRGYWQECKMNYASCDAYQIQVLQGIHFLLFSSFGFVKTGKPFFINMASFYNEGFRNQMLNAVRGFSTSGQNGLFINSCFAHCQSERQDTWYSNNSPLIGNKVSYTKTTWIQFEY